MRFAERGLYVEAYVKCSNCGVLVYDSDDASEDAPDGPVFCSTWCQEWAADRDRRRDREGRVLS